MGASESKSKEEVPIVIDCGPEGHRLYYGERNKDNQPHGQGELCDLDGFVRYRGGFSEGMMHGDGHIFDRNGTRMGVKHKNGAVVSCDLFVVSART